MKCWLSVRWFFPAIVGSLSLTPGCASQARLVGDVDDYEQYRRVRVGERFDARLSAGWTYLRRFPDGAFREEVEAWFQVAEERYRTRAWNSQTRLHGYLRVLPDGPHTSVVRRRLARLEQEARSRAVEETSFMRRERERQLRFDEAKASRTEFRRAFEEWLITLSGTRDFGKPRDAWDPELSRRFFDEEPPGLCEAATCEKTMRMEFEIPTAKGLTERAADFVVVLRTKDGALESAEVRGYELWSRVGESANLEAVEYEQLQARAEAIGAAVEVVAMTIELSFPTEHCDVEAISPDVLLRRCDGRQLVMTIGEDFTDPDRLVITRPAGAADPALRRRVS